MTIEFKWRRFALTATIIASLYDISADGKTVYYDNSLTKWEKPTAYIWDDNGNNGWPGEGMTKVDGYDYLYSFETTLDGRECPNIIFNVGSNAHQSADLNANEFTVCRLPSEGNKQNGTLFQSLDEWIASLNNPNPNPDPNPEPNPDPDPEPNPDFVERNDMLWLSKDKPSVSESVTVYFNAKNTTFNNTSNPIYLYSWTEGGNIHSKWSDWSTRPSDEDCLMIPVDGHPNFFYYTISPSIQDYFNVGDDSTSTNKLGIIIRNAEGTKANSEDKFFDVSPAAPRPVISEIGGYKSHEISSDPNGYPCVKVIAEHGTVYITPYADKIVKVFTLPENVTDKERKSISVSLTPANCQISLLEDLEESVAFSVGETTYVIVDKSNCSVAFAENETSNVKLAEQGGIDNRSGHRNVSFKGMDDAAFYGAGYHGRDINLDGRSMRLDNTQTGNWSATQYEYPHNVCIPFFVSTNSYGVLFDDHYRSAVMRPSSQGSTYTTGSKNPIAYYYIGGDDMQSVVENYTLLTGRQQMPPYWALGYITSRYGYHSFSEAEGYVDAIKNKDIPVDGVVFDLYWQGYDESGMGNLTFTDNGFSNPSEWLNRMKRDKKVHTVVITEPFFTNRSANYSVLKDRGFLADEDVNDMGWLKSDKVGLIDASNPSALDYMNEFYTARINEGVDGHWMDLGEPERHDYDSNHAGGTVDQVHNEFGLLWVESVYNNWRQKFPDMRPLLMPRAGTSGMQRYSTFPWTGDISRSWEGLQAQVPALVSGAMSGVSYLGSDIGGFISQGTNPNLYLRWIELATFYPMCRTHSSDNPEPSHSCYSGVVKDVAKFINLRYQYLPYTYTLAWQNTSKGTPIARPVNMHNSNPGSDKNEIGSYLWGRDIFVAPVLDNSDSKTITFPEGKWLDLNNYDVIYDGGTTSGYNAPLDKLPYFGRLGSFIPRYTQTTFENTASADNTSYTVDFIVDPDGESIGYLFDDDRKTPSDNPGYGYMLTTFEGKHTDDQISIDISHKINGNYEGMPEAHNFIFVIHNWDGVQKLNGASSVNGGSSTVVPYAMTDEPADETVNDITQVFTRDQLDSHEGDAYYADVTNNKVYVKATIPTDRFRAITLTSEGGITTSTDALTANTMKLFYGAGMLNYSLADNIANGVIRVYDTAGVLTAEFAADHADGMVHQHPFDAAPGIYVAVLSADTPAGAHSDVRTKIIVK